MKQRVKEYMEQFSQSVRPVLRKEGCRFLLSHDAGVVGKPSIPLDLYAEMPVHPCIPNVPNTQRTMSLKTYNIFQKTSGIEAGETEIL